MIITRRPLVAALLSITACKDVDPDLVAERQLPAAVVADVQAVSRANNDHVTGSILFLGRVDDPR